MHNVHILMNVKAKTLKVLQDHETLWASLQIESASSLKTLFGTVIHCSCSRRREQLPGKFCNAMFRRHIYKVTQVKFASLVANSISEDTFPLYFTPVSPLLYKTLTADKLS